MSRAALLDSYYLLSCALVLTLFLFQKGQGFFPPLPIATLLLRSWRWADLNSVSWEVTAWLGWFRSAEKRICFFFCVGEEPIQTAPRKRPAWFPSHAGFFQRAMRPVAEWRPFLSNEQKTTSDPRAARLVAERR